MARTRPDVIDHLTGRLSDLPRPPGISLPGGGGKFTPDGAVQHWPGNTFICHIPQTSAAYSAIHELQDTVKKSPFQRFFTFLPPPSFHMTVFQGLSPDMTAAIGLPESFPEGLPRDEASAILAEQLDGLDLPTHFRIMVDGLFAAHSLTVSGADETEETALRQVRATLGDATGIQFADFDDYIFHITIAYLIDWLPEATAREIAEFSSEVDRRFQGEIGHIELGPVEFCNFDSMHHFEPVRILA